MKKVLKFLGRVFLKITGFLPYLLYLKPKCIYTSAKAKEDFHNLKNGALIVSNHTRIFDYYVYMFKLLFKVVHTMVADVVYKKVGLGILNSVLENIKIYRNGMPNLAAISEAENYLTNKKVVLIFPEGKLEDKKGKLEKFSNTASYLSVKTQKPIIPIYIDGRYGLFKRVRYVIGEAIYPEANVSLETNDLNEYTDNIVENIKKLKNTAKMQLKHKTKQFFACHYFIMDVIRFVSIPWFYLIFITKKYYLGSRKNVSKALKYNCMIAGNHLGPCDPFFIYFHFFRRRIRLIATEQLFDVKGIKYWLVKSRVIKYHRDSMNHIDVDAFKDALETLEGNGVIGIFPEGHINFTGLLEDNIKEGTATMSLMTNSPVIPFVFINQYRYFRINRVLIGDPIYPKDYIDLNGPITVDKINDYNKVIYDKLKSMYEEALKRRKPNDTRGNITITH